MIPQKYAVWPGLAPGEQSSFAGTSITTDNITRVSDVTGPEIFVYADGLPNNPHALPRPATWQSSPQGKPIVLVLPGGGYSILAADLEGTEVAEWLFGLGFVTAVLHYRCPEQRDKAYQDARRAVSWLRAHAEEFGATAKCVGVIGFSAGGHLTTRLGAQGGERYYDAVDSVDMYPCRPDFAMPIYPAYLLDAATGQVNKEVLPTKEMPPMFIAQTRDDDHFCADRYAEAAQNAGADITCKIYPTGGHGYGVRTSKDNPAPDWTADAAEWLQRFIA